MRIVSLKVKSLDSIKSSVYAILIPAINGVILSII